MNPGGNRFPPEPSPPDPTGIGAVAAQWVKRRDAGLAPSEREQFRAWLAEDPSHGAALAKADTQADEFDWLWHAGAVDEVAAGLERRAQKRTRRRKVAAAVGAAAVLTVVGFWQARRVPSGGLPSASPAVVTLPFRQVLPDGSVVELKDGARISCAFSDSLRRVLLRGGTAFFEVAKDPARPFVVEASGVEVRAVGTAFSVQLGATAMEILVTEGRVAVDQAHPAAAVPARGGEEPPPFRTFVSAGHMLEVDLARMAAGQAVVRLVPGSEQDEKLAWREPLLKFSGTPLDEVVATMNRYNRVQIVIGDPALGRQQLSGVLRADRIEALLQMVASDFGIKAERRSDAEIVLRKNP